MKRCDEERALAPALVFVDHAHDRGQNIRVPSTARGSKAETRISLVILLEWERICSWLSGGGRCCC